MVCSWCAWFFSTCTGSIFISTKEIDGHGSITSDGGSASCTGLASNTLICGGGSGGRIALHFTNDLHWWNGKVTAYGGLGSHGASPGAYGGAGTVFYTKKTLAGTQTTWLETKNNRGEFATEVQLSSAVRFYCECGSWWNFDKWFQNVLNSAVSPLRLVFYEHLFPLLAVFEDTRH